VLGTILLIVLSAFVLGAVGRWAIPGPDPMPVWLTILFGLGGSLIGGLVTALVLGASKDVSQADYFTIVMAQILATVGLLFLYRRFYQRRPLTGPDAKRPPTKGIGLRPGGGGRPVSATKKQELLRRIDELHDAGLLTEEEYVEKRRAVLREQA
jgi:uncharacterized membrane protein YeaQ/YmgE (transglycosylase-associated protein family)